MNIEVYFNVCIHFVESYNILKFLTFFTYSAGDMIVQKKKKKRKKGL